MLTLLSTSLHEPAICIHMRAHPAVHGLPSIPGQDYLGSDKKVRGGGGECVLPLLISFLHHVVKDLGLRCRPHHQRGQKHQNESVPSTTDVDL